MSAGAQAGAQGRALARTQAPVPAHLKKAVEATTYGVQPAPFMLLTGLHTVHILHTTSRGASC